LSNFAFLQNEWPEVFEAARRAEDMVHPDPRTACFYARRALELAVHWAYKSDAALHLPYQDNLSALIHAPDFKSTAGEAVFRKARVITQLGNQAVHSARVVQVSDARTAVGELFHVGYWLARTYARANKPGPDITFDPALLPTSAPIPRQTLDQLQALERQLAERDQRLSALLADHTTLHEERERLRAEVARARAAAQPDTHDYGEAATRACLIDLLLHEVGWPLDKPDDREFEVRGMPNAQGKGFVDYVLWGDDGLPLALIEAKRSTVSPMVGRQQAKLYADCLEQRYGRRPVIFLTNGYEHELWDDVSFPPRAVEGFYKKAELELLHLRRRTRQRLATAPINTTIAGRFYQERAIRRIGEAFEQQERKALIVMATGSGKTRTVIALCEQLMAANWAKRILFLADRVALVKQAEGAFKKYLADSSPVNLVTDRKTDGRVYVSTYPTMMGLIDEMEGGQRRFGVGHFDLIIIDEAHRSVYQKYGAIFRYFDALLVGLTATPKDEIDSNTFRVFDLEPGVPTDTYPLEEAVKDGFLVPPKAVSVPLKFVHEGIKYDELSDEEKEEWDAKDWDDEGEPPKEVDAEAVNRWLFNADTIDKVLEHLMTRGQTVAGGDRLGKTILFAKNQKHAEFIAKRFDINYPYYKGAFAQVVHCDLPYAQSLIDDFAEPEKAPHLAISVDMLDTGIDVPEVVNLVFFKVVRSKTKFWQMVGRGTRLREHLFGPDRHKQFFYIFDFCGNLEFFRQSPETSEGSLAQSLGARLFRTRLELIGALGQPAETLGVAEPDRVAYNGDVATPAQLRAAVATLLHAEVESMNLDNFIVRPKRRLVEKYQEGPAWAALDPAAITELSTEVAGLPHQLEPEKEESRRFDLLLLKLQLARLRVAPAFAGLAKQVREIAGRLEEKSAIPMVKDQIALIQDVQTDAWWEDVTLPMLENVRRRLRALVPFLDKVSRTLVYTDFEDQMGTPVEIALPAFAEPATYERFLAKARAFLTQHQNQLTIHKLRMNKALTQTDLDELERMLASSGLGDAASLQRAKEESEGLGLFVRSLVGLDREAAKAAFAGFLTGRRLNANQIELVDMIINHLTEHGVMSAAALYESPFTDLDQRGPEGLFSAAQVDELAEILHRVRGAAVAA
jgi:type I restriction enzyme R subunit